MKQRIHQTHQLLSSCYLLLWFTYLFSLAANLLQLFPTIAETTEADAVRLRYLTESVTILCTALCIPLSLKLFAWALSHRINTLSTIEAVKRYRCWSLLRLLLLWIPILAGSVTYLLFSSLTGILCMSIALVATLFCRPTMKNILRELHLSAEEEEQIA